VLLCVLITCDSTEIAWFLHLKLSYHRLLTNFAFIRNLRRYVSARVSELVLAERAARVDAESARRDLRLATDHIAELEDGLQAAGADAPRAFSLPVHTVDASLDVARGDAMDSEAASSALSSRLTAAERLRSAAEDRLSVRRCRLTFVLAHSEHVIISDSFTDSTPLCVVIL